MPRFPTPADTLKMSIQTSIRLAEAGTVFWLALFNSGLWWLPKEARPAVLTVSVPVSVAPTRSRAKRARG